MGAGCYYTHDTIDSRAFWIDFEPPEDEVEAHWMVDDLAYLFEQNGYDKYDSYTFQNGLAEIKLESTYYGDGLIIKLNPYEDERYGLAVANHDRMYDKIKRILLDAGYTLRIATSGYTSTQITE